MGLKAHVRRGAGDRLALIMVLCAAVSSFAAIDWLKAHLGDHFLKFIVLGLGILTVALALFTWTRLKASGIKPPSWKDLRRTGSRDDGAGERPGSEATDADDKKGGL